MVHGIEVGGHLLYVAGPEFADEEEGLFAEFFF